MYKIRKLILLIIPFLLGGCAQEGQDIEEREIFKEVYQQKKGHSDKKAVKIALEVMDSSGGYQRWQEARYLNWIFFGSRRWMWDKQTGDVRVHDIDNDLTILMNLNSKEGKVFKDTQRVTNKDSVEKFLKRGYRMWANDSYWVFMPFKLIDSGVKLKYEGEGATPAPQEEKADILKVSFKDVGVTPKNYYKVYVSKKTRRVRWWEYYPTEDKEKPFISTPWTNYQDFKGLKLSLSHGGKNKITEVSVRDSMNRAVFEELNPLDSAHVIEHKPAS